MASYSLTVGGKPSGVNKSLSGTTADTVTVDASAGNTRVVIKNRGAAAISARFDGSTAVLDADGTVPIDAGESLDIYIGSGSYAMSIVGNGTAYAVVAFPYGSW